MSEEKSPQEVEEVKTHIKIEVEEGDVEELKAGEKKQAGPDLVAEFQSLGRTFAEAFETAWNSEERKRVEAEVREGVRTFADEVDKVIREAKSSPAGQRVRDEAAGAANKFESSEIGRRALEGISQGLAWMSVEMGKLAEQFTPAEKTPPEEGEEQTE